MNEDDRRRIAMQAFEDAKVSSYWLGVVQTLRALLWGVGLPLLVWFIASTAGPT